MADFSIPITVPDARVLDIIAALRMKYGQKVKRSFKDNEEIIVVTDYTPVELRVLLKGEVERIIRAAYEDYILKQASDSITPIAVT